MTATLIISGTLLLITFGWFIYEMEHKSKKK